MYVCMCVRVLVCVCVHLCVCVSVCVCVCSCTCMSVLPRSRNVEATDSSQHPMCLHLTQPGCFIHQKGEGICFPVNLANQKQTSVVGGVTNLWEG